MKKLLQISILSCLFLLGCESNKSKTNKQAGKDTTLIEQKKDSIPASMPNKSLEDKILDAVLSLPECREANRQIDSLSHHKHGLSTMIEKPDKPGDNYGVKAGYDNPERFETYYNFIINPKTFEVKIMDAIEGDEVTMDVWRAREKKRK